MVSEFLTLQFAGNKYGENWAQELVKNAIKILTDHQDEIDWCSLSENKNANKSGRTNRPEMNGPTDIDGILAGLKTKKINIQESPGTSNPQTAENSTISINDLKDLQTNGKIPNKSKRKPRSNKNTISLDI